MNKTVFESELRSRLLANACGVLRVLRSPDGECVEYRGRDLVDAADTAVRPYSDSKRGRVVLLLLPHCPELFLLHLGFVLSGDCPAILPWPTTRVDAAKYQRNLMHQLQNLSADLLITLPRLSGSLRGHVGFAVHSCSIDNSAAFETMFASRLQMEPGEIQGRDGEPGGVPKDAVFIQFSGGTTGMQKAVIVTSGMLHAQLERLALTLSFSSDDCVVSWLPMYHDMGLIACLWLPLWAGSASVQMAASDWLLCPEKLFEVIERYRGTFCWLPNFAFAYLADRAPAMRNYNLDHVRAFINCSEPVRNSSLTLFLSAFERFGVRRNHLQASYAMAENVFAVTQTHLDGAPVSVSREVVRADDGRPLAFGLGEQVFVSSGRRLSDTAVKIVAPLGTPCADGVAGEILIRSESLFSGYWNGAGLDRYLMSRDGYHRTGDYGFMLDGELYVIGRIKDLIIVAGQNIFPEDVEALVNAIPGVYPGRTVAFGLDESSRGTEGLVVVAELRGDHTPESTRKIEVEIRNTVLAGIGVAPRYALVVPQRWVVKSTAGKISRRDTRQRFLDERGALGR